MKIHDMKSYFNLIIVLEEFNRYEYAYMDDDENILDMIGEVLVEYDKAYNTKYIEYYEDAADDHPDKFLNPEFINTLLMRAEVPYILVRLKIDDDIPLVYAFKRYNNSTNVVKNIDRLYEVKSKNK